MDKKRSGAWEIKNTDFSEEALARSSSVFSISNGYFSLKGDLFAALGDRSPTTIIAGVFDEADMFSLLRPTREERPFLDAAHFDEAGKSPSVANLPNPLFLKIFVEGEEISFRRGKVKGFEQALDLRRGLYTCRFEFEDDEKRNTLVTMSRFCDMNNIHSAALRCIVAPLNYAGTIRIHSGIDGDIRSNLAFNRQFEVRNSGREGSSGCFMHARTLSRRIDIEMRVHTGLAGAHGAAWEWTVGDRAVTGSIARKVERGKELVLEKFVSVASSEDPIHGVECDSQRELEKSVEEGFDKALEGQAAFWEEAWARADVAIEGDDRAQQSLRFCLYHLIAAAPRHTDKLSVPCKLLTGEYYQGTVFYDTDLYILPFYMFTEPGWARNCLSYRFHSLDASRKLARELGFEGAKFAWQAGPKGEEALGKWWRFHRTNVHINGDVAYSLMRYFRATGDRTFLFEKGAEILIEAARFYLSRMEYDEEWDQYDLREVAGPDESHCRSSNNFYTNYLVSCTLRDAAEAVERVKTEDSEQYAAIASRLDLERSAPEKWRKAAEKITILFDDETGRYEQCEGFFDLPPAPDDLLEERKDWFVPLASYQAMNQPDVVMALVLFRDRFPEEVKRANWEYYKALSMNFSSMSFAVNAIMAAELGEMNEAYENFLITAGMDLDECLTERKDASAGIHGTACGGAWMAAVFGFGGVCLTEEKLIVQPRLPAEWKALRFRLKIEGEDLEFSITKKKMTVAIGKKADLNLAPRIGERDLTLRSGEAVEVSYA